MDNDRKLYFAYGSNLHIDQMSRRCPAATKVGPLLVDNGALVFRSVADVIYKPNSQVAGGLWTITPDCEERLDQYEGVDSGLYVKKYLPLSGGRYALYYKMNVRGIMPPAELYLNTIVQGYRDFGLDEYIPLLNRAVEHSYARKFKTPYLRNRHKRKGEPKLARPFGQTPPPWQPQIVTPEPEQEPIATEEGQECHD